MNGWNRRYNILIVRYRFIIMKKMVSDAAEGVE